MTTTSAVVTYEVSMCFIFGRQSRAFGINSNNASIAIAITRQQIYHVTMILMSYILRVLLHQQTKALILRWEGRTCATRYECIPSLYITLEGCLY